MLTDELKQLGCTDAVMDDYGYVFATVPENLPSDHPAAGKVPTVGLIAHVDTYFGTSGKDVKPQVIENFDGQDIRLTGDPTKVITAASCAELPLAAGKTIITTDGTTLLGGDDKAGVAIIMEVAQHLIEHPEIQRGPVRIFFTCDEEIGKGVDHVDVDAIGAVACYNFDGGGQNDIDQETFSADLAVVTFTGVNIHPAIAKDKMVNALRAAGHFLAALPADLLQRLHDARHFQSGRWAMASAGRGRDSRGGCY